MGWVQIAEQACHWRDVRGPGGRGGFHEAWNFPTEAEARAACLADASCHAVMDAGCDGSGYFQTCSSSTGIRDRSTCMYDYRQQPPDFSCAPFELVAGANSTRGYDRKSCCDIPCTGGTMADFGYHSSDERFAGVCVPCPFPSRCVDGITCRLNSEGRGCATCVIDYFKVVSVNQYLPTASDSRPANM